MSCALVTYGTQVTYQRSESTRGETTTSSVQERFKFFFDISSNPTTNLSLFTNMSFDILGNQRSGGTESLQIQPAIDFRLATPALRLGLGYREILRDDNIISGTSTSTISDESSDLFADTSLHVDNFPDVRLRFSRRAQTRTENSLINTDSTTDDVQAGMNYAFSVFSLNANYGVQSTKNKLSGSQSDLTQINGTASVLKSLGGWAQAIARATYSLSEGTTDGTTESERSATSGEVRLNTTPFERAVLNGSYLYRSTEDLTSTVGASTEQNWLAMMNYAFPRFVRVYGTYNKRVKDDPDSVTTTDIKIAGMTFNHSIERLILSAGYEKRLQDTTVEGEGSSETSLDRDVIHWSASSRLFQTLLATLSQAIVINSVNDNTTDVNRYRFTLVFGPVYDFTASPFVDYTVVTPSNNIVTKTTQLVVPASFNLVLSESVSLKFTDNYTWRKTERLDIITNVQSNSAVIRLDWNSPVSDLRFSADASLSSNSTDTTSSSTGSYSLRASWRQSVHRVNTNIRYQTGSNRVDSGSLSAQYGLDLRIKRFQLSLQANYTYSITFSTPESTSSGFFIALRLRK